MFKALVLHEEDGKVESRIEELEESRLPEGDVTVEVSHSTLNYKDGMVVKGIGRLVRSYPHVPGVDFAGTVLESASPDYEPGDKVVLTGWRVGETHWGGYAEKARVKSDWLVPLPEGLSPAEAMAVGTAGFTAMLAVMALEAHGIGPELVEHDDDDRRDDRSGDRSGDRSHERRATTSAALPCSPTIGSAPSRSAAIRCS